MNNFYIAGGTVPRFADCYVEREADKAVLDCLLTGEYVYALEPRQMGKSSLAIRTLGKLTDLGIRTVYLDLTKFGSANITPEQWYGALLREVGRDLGLMPTIATYWKGSIGASPADRFFGGISHVLESRPLAIFIDEIDVTRSLPFDTDSFFAGIRQCFDQRALIPELENLTFCLSGCAVPSSLIQETSASPFTVGRRIELTDFQLDQALVLARNLGEPLLREVFEWTGGHPYLTQRVCCFLVQHGEANVERVCDALFFSHRAKESEHNLASVRSWLLHDKDLAQPILELYLSVLNGARVIFEDADLHHAILRLSGVARVTAGRLQVRNRIYEAVFDEQWVSVVTHFASGL